MQNRTNYFEEFWASRSGISSALQNEPVDMNRKILDGGFLPKTATPGKTRGGHVKLFHLSINMAYAVGGISTDKHPNTICFVK